MKTFLCVLTMSFFSVFAYGQQEPDFEMEPFVFNQGELYQTSDLLELWHWIF